MKKDAIRLLVIFLVAVGAVFWALNYLFLSSNTAQKSKASGETVDISYDPASPTVAANADTTILVRMRPSANISLRGYTLKMKFNKAILKAKYIDYRVGIPSPDFGDTSGTLATVNDTGTINIQGEIQNSTGLIMNGNSTVDLVRLVFTAASATGTTIDVSNANFYLVNPDGTISTNFISAVADLKVNGGAATASCINYTDNFSATTLNSAWSLWTSGAGTAVPDGGRLNIGLPASSEVVGKIIGAETINKPLAGDFTSEITFISRNDNATYAFFQFNNGLESNTGQGFDGFGFRLINGTLHTEVYGTINPNNPGAQNHGIPVSETTPVKLKLERAGTAAKMYYDLMDGAGYRLIRTFPNFNTANGRAVAGVAHTGPANLQLNAKFDDYKQTCVGTVIPTVTLTPTATPIPTPTGTIPVTGNVKINLKLKFQGIAANPATPRNFMNVKFTLGGADLTTQLVKSGSFFADASGVWSGKVGFDLTAPAGKKYNLYVKGPKHIQKKICDIAPTENPAGTYRCSTANVTLAVGENTLDLSKILLLSGDIYGPDKVQDGIVNSVDISYVKNNLNKNDAGILAVCDINLDGKCDTQDYSLILSALSIKSDEL